MIIRLATASAAALALAACSAEETEAPSAEDTTAAAAPAAEAPDPSTPQGFVTAVASSDMYEIEAGRLAGQLGSGQEVKDFGAMMVRDHTASSDKLKAAVANGGAQQTVPAAMLPKHQQLLAALRNAGDAFDSVYLQQQAAAHQEALALLQGQGDSGTVEPLKAFAAAAVPVVEGHLTHLRELADAGGGE